MKDYENYSDEELVVRIQDGETEITDYIIKKYKNLVRQKAKSLFLLGADNEDLIQEGMIGLFKAVRDYDAGRDAAFFTFADICVSRQMLTAVQASQRKKHIPLNQYVSLYGTGTQEDGEDLQLIHALVSVTDRNPEELTINNELIQEIEKVMENDLSVLERQVIELHLTGMGYHEIAKILGRDEKSTDNALQRAKHKIRKGMEN